MSLAYGQVTDRLPKQLQAAATFTLHGNVRPAIATAQDQGAVPSAYPISRIAIRFKLTAAQEAELAQLLIDQQTPGTATYHHWLTPEQFADRFGLSTADAHTVAAWLSSFHFTGIEIAPSRTSVSFSGTVGQVQAAFGTSIHSYVSNGELHFANATDPVLPNELDGIVEAITGLHDFHFKPQHVRPSAARTAPDFSTSSGQFLAPDDFAAIYDVKPLYAAGIDGSGEKIAVVGESDINISDIQAFRSAARLPRKNPIVVLTGPDPGTRAGPETEADLDLEWAGGIARNATIIYVNSTDAMESAAYAIEHNLAPVLSISYGACETDIGSAGLAALNSIFQQANVQGMTVLVSSGDWGATSCETPTTTSATHGLAVAAPASLPYVTAVGGTTLGDGNWGGINNPAGGSAAGYEWEVAWNDTELYGGPLAASGGGESVAVAKPAWQNGPGVPNDRARDVPDISLAASPDEHGYLICSNGSCTNGFWSASGGLDIVGGTSCGAPAMAGIIALLDQLTGSAQGNVNPELYRLASFSSNAFHDVTLGDNLMPCSIGTPDCITGSEGYLAASNYDQVTGLGSIDAYTLLSQWHEPAPVALAAMPFGTAKIAAGPDGSLWGIDDLGHANTYNAQTQSWTQAATVSILQLTVGPGGNVWAIDFFGNSYHWNPTSQTFVPVPGTFSSISVGADGDTWALDSRLFSGWSPVYRFDASAQQWVQVPGSLSSIAVGFDGAVWGLNPVGQIFRYNPALGSFEYVPGSLNTLAVGSDGGVWGINDNWNTYHFNRLHQSWDQIPGSMTGFAVGSETNVWGLGLADSAAYRYSSRADNWYLTAAPRIFSLVAAPDGSAWGVDGQQVYQLSPATRTLNSWHQIPGQLASLAAASDGNVWGLNALGQIYAFDPLLQSWTLIPGTLSQIAVARDGAVWGVNPEGSVYQYDYSKLGWKLMPGTLSQITLADKGDVWGLDAEQRVYRFDPSAQNWTSIPGYLTQLSVGADGEAWGIDSESHVYRFDPQAGVFALRPGSMAQISVGSSNNVWALDAAGLIYRFDPGAHTWQSVPGQLAQIRVAFDGSVWGINSQQSIWRYNPGTGSWDSIPGALTSLSVGSDAVVWGINAAGATYYFQ
jgi:Tectonin domain/Pro-kumamolisin, activation domain/Subtilase family